MVAFSCCVFDGGEQENEDMIAARERGWRGKFTKPGRVIRPGAIRINGKCPLTPLEVPVVCLGYLKSFPRCTHSLLLVQEVQCWSMDSRNVLSWVDTFISF